MNRKNALLSHCDRLNFGRQIGLVLYRPRNDGSTDVAVSVQFVQVERDDAAPVNHSMVLEPPEAQSLMDALWCAGVRPTEEGSAGQLAAVQSHLTDMRQIAFDLLKKGAGGSHG